METKTHDHQKVSFSQSLSKMNQSPSTRDASRRMSEPMNIRVCINKYNNNVNKDFVVVSQSSKTKIENRRVPNNNFNTKE